MIEAKKETDENPYILSKEERTCPKRLSTKEKRAWLEERIALQREGIDHGIRPQNLRGLPKSLKKAWQGRVWGYHIRKQPIEVQRIIRRT